MQATFDNGKNSCKYIIDNERYIVESKIEEGISTFGEETLKFEGKNYIIGDEASDYNYTFTKNNLHHKLMIYYCLARHARENEKIDLIIGCPLSTYINKEEQDKYSKYIMNDGKPITVEYKGKEKTFTINSVVVAPENIGGYINDFNISKRQIRGVVDIGGLNINCGIYDKGKPVKDKMFTLNLGIHILIKNIQQAVLREKENFINNYMCKHLLLNMHDLDEDLYKIFDMECKKFVKLIKKSLIKNEWELEHLNMRFIGGGSIILEDYIEQEFKKPYIEKDIFANCEAFRKFGARKNAKK